MLGGKRLYDKRQIEQQLLGTGTETETNEEEETAEKQAETVKERVGICYARVSIRQQQQAGDFERQVEDLKQAYPDYEII